MVTRFVFALIVILLVQAGLPALAQEQQEGQEARGITNRSTTIHIIDEKPYYLHAVLQGQTLYSIARAYGVAQEDILEENPDVRYGLQYNQVIRIPVDEEDFDEEDIRRTEPVEIREVAPEPRGDFTGHEVQRQETLFGLSQQYGVSIEEILFYNPQARGGLQVGHVLRIPAVDPGEAQVTEFETDGEYRLYTVSSGETKFGISQQFGLTVEVLERLNPDIREGLQAGQEIRVPTEPMAAAEREPQRERQSYIFLPTDSHREVAPRPDAYCFEPEHKDHYQVALLIPLFLEEVDLPGKLPFMEDRLPVTVPEELLNNRTGRGDSGSRRAGILPLDHPSFAFLSYYQGALLALDSLREQGMDVTLHVYDVCEQLPKARRATDSNGFQDMDLIIGPFYEQTLDYIAAYGRRHDIPVVSPLLPANHHLRDMPNLFKATPSLETMLSEVANYVSVNYPRQNILLVHNNQPGAQEVISAFQDTLLQNVAMRNHFYDSLQLARVNGYYYDGTLVGNRRVSQLVAESGAGQMPGMISGRRVARPENVQEVIYRHEGIEGVLGKMRPDQKNVLITLISGEPFLSDYLRRLHEYRREFDISVFGIPEWEDYQSIEIDYLQNLNVHTFTPDFYDYRDLHIQDFVNRYRGVYHTEPDDDAFKGAQTIYFFLNALYEYGKDFDRCMALLNNRGFESPFSFKRPFGTGHGWENTNTSIYRIQNYRRVDVSRPIEIFAGEVSEENEE